MNFFAFPAILCISENGAVEKQLQRQITKTLFSSGEDLKFYTSTNYALMQSTKDDDTIWLSPDVPNKLYALDSLFGDTV